MWVITQKGKLVNLSRAEAVSILKVLGQWDVYASFGPDRDYNIAVC